MSFKVGDWVRVKYPSYEEVLYCKEDEKRDEQSILLSNGEFTAKSLIELWKPKKGEWCWFRLKDEIVVKQFDMPLHYVYLFHDNVEPFIGELSTWIKDKQ